MIHPRSRTIINGLAIGAALVAAGAVLTGQAAQPHTRPAPSPPAIPTAPGQPADTARARLAAAERVCKMLHDRATGEPHGHQSVEHIYLWSKRRMQAEIEVERTKPGGDGGIAAIQRHVEWMRAWAKEVADAQAKGAYSTFDTASTEFYVAEAEDLLAQAEGGRARHDGGTP